MAFIKKKWVNVPDPSNPPSIPEGQDALARFDADNMNRIEDGIAKATEDLLGKAPAGHGLGDYADNHSGVSIKSIMHKGCGFYQVNRVPDVDNPADTGAWLTLLQMARGIKENEETGVQILCSDLKVDNPRMWFRNMLTGVTSNWVEMLHTGNYSKFANARITTGSYVGVVSKTNSGSIPSSEVVLSFDFVPKLIILQGKTSSNKEFTAIFPYGCDGHYIIVGASNSVSSGMPSTFWEGNSVKLALSQLNSDHLNWSGNTYTYVAIG